MILTRAIGIDLGTTNSAVALLDPNDRDLVLWKDAQDRAIVPSCIWCDPRNGEVIVGHKAYARKGTRPEPVSSIKRSMGTQMTVDFAGAQRTPAEISAYILRELKAQMESELRRRTPEGVSYDLSRAIITVPAYFGLPATEATRKAGEQAGLEVTELLHEPTAAAIYYSWKHNLGDGIYLVYDLGGGTFDVSILQRTAGEFLVLGIFGDNFLGGDDFDRRLAEHLRQLLVDDGYDFDLDVANDPEDRLRFNQLMTIAERAKKELSEREEFVLRDQGTMRDRSGTPVVIETTITRATFEALIGDLLDRTVDCCGKAMERAHEKSGVSVGSLDHILLVGGSTYVPAVMEKVRKAFCSGLSGVQAACAAPIRDDPDTAVALGAALRAATAGLGVGDDERRVRLWFRGAGATRREQATISGHVELLAGDMALEGGMLRLSSEHGASVVELELKADLRFSFSQVPLEAESVNDFRFELLDVSGNTLAVLGRSILHASDQKEAVGRALSTAVLAKPILLEGTDGDRVVRHVLLAEGASLPAKAQYTFAVSDPGGRIRIPIYQESRIIKELHASVGSVPVGTPVEVAVLCDEQVHIEVSFAIGEKVFGGAIESPPPDSVPTEFEVEHLEDRFAAALERLESEDIARLEAAFGTARRDLQEARAGADYPKVIQRAADLEGLVREARLAEPLQPPLATVEKNVASCLELLPQAEQVKPELAQAHLRQDLQAMMERARQAYQKRDRQTYEDSAQAITMTLQVLAGVNHARVAEDKDIDIAVRASIAVEQARQMTQFLLINCLMGGQTKYVGTLTQQLEEIGQLAEEVGSDPVIVLNRCQVMITEARRIHQQISPEEKGDNELEGLLRVDPRKHAAAAGIPKGGLGKL